MQEVQLRLDEQQQGAFYAMDGGEEMGEMVIGISGKTLTVFHTEVSPAAEGKGVAKQLLSSMVAYARKHEMKVIPLCPFVHAQFKRHPAEYEDIWLKQGADQ